MRANKKNILVFPCGSEVGLEIHRSLKYSIHINLIGANSVDDHGKFIYKQYVPDLPFFTEPNFIPYLKRIIEDFNIDAVYPTMDSVTVLLKEQEEELGSKVICSGLETVQTCLSKKKTYRVLSPFVRVPRLYDNIAAVEKYPIFLKPEVGYGSRNTLKALNEQEVRSHLSKNKNQLILEYLPGEELTVDCFTNFKGELLFIGPRKRRRTLNGISVNTITVPIYEEIKKMATTINEVMTLDGAWFFQIKKASDGNFCLLEIASRIAGSSSANRIKGVNLALLNVFNAFEHEVKIVPNDYEVELDRAFSCKFKLDLEFQYVYVDLDDTLLLGNCLNVELISCLYSFINEKKNLILITKHLYNVEDTLKKWRVFQLFDQIIHISKEQEKHEFINHQNAIFIDDSHEERTKIAEKIKIPVFAPDMVQALI